MGFLAGLLGAVAGPVISGLFGGAAQRQQNAQNQQNSQNAQTNAYNLEQQGLQNALANMMQQYQNNPNPAIGMENIQGPPQWGGTLGGGELGQNGLPVPLQAPQPAGQFDLNTFLQMLTGGQQGPAAPPQSRVNNLPGNRLSGSPVYEGPIEGRLSPILRNIGNRGL